MADLVVQIEAFCQRYALLPPGASIVVAVSGGPDSLCLLHVLRQIAGLRQLRLHVAHLDHQLRPESADDARFVAATAAEWQLPVTVASADVAAHARSTHTGIETAARALRLRFLVHTAESIGATAIALGHTADDQAETVVMRLLRGAATGGLAAMRPSRPVDRHHPGISLIRPLLETTREQIEQYCAAHELQPHHDASNDLPIYTRNRVRGYILPLLKPYNPNIVATLGRTARICAEDDEYLAEHARQTLRQIAQIDAAHVLIDRQPFLALHRAMQRRVLRLAVEQIDDTIDIEARHLDLALSAIAERRRGAQLPGGIRIDVTSRVVRIRRKA